MLKIPRLIVALILVVLLLGVGALHAAQDGPSLAPIAQEIPAESYELVGENEKFQLYASQETLAFKVVDKRNGYIWHSNLDEVTEEDNLNRTWTAFAQSGISINYLDQSADNERNSITAAEHTLEFEPIEQGFQASVTFTDPSITVGVVVQLEADGVRVEVPFDRLREADPEYKLGMLHLYPFFGATRADTVRGYMFIPDGSGTLIKATTRREHNYGAMGGRPGRSARCPTTRS